MVGNRDSLFCDVSCNISFGIQYLSANSLSLIETQNIHINGKYISISATNQAAIEQTKLYYYYYYYYYYCYCCYYYYYYYY